MPESQKVVVVCGAGASTAFGTEGRPIPLMPQLNDAVCQALDAVEPGFAGAVRLEPGISGTEFETALGEVFALERSFGRIEQLRDLFIPSFADLGTSHARKRDLYINGAKTHLEQAQTVVRDTLFAEFGGQRVDRLAAANGWTMLANALQVQLPELLIATTNYDPSATRALEKLGHPVRRGFSQRASEPRILEPEGLGVWQASSIAVIHLHGAVGWYRTGPDRIEDHGADHPKPIGDFGPPALLYPEPNKDPDRGVVKELWSEFDTALRAAKKVLVAGHSLADQHLVERLKPHADRVAVLRRSVDQSARKDIDLQTRRTLVGASVVWGQFGPDGYIENDKAFKDWWGQDSAVSKPPVVIDSEETA